MPDPLLPIAAPSPGRAVETGIPGTVGEAVAIAPDTFVVPGWWSSRTDGLGIPVATLVVRGAASIVVDTAPAPLAPDWLAAVLALVDAEDVRWIVATGRDPARIGCLGALVTACPRATVVLPGSARSTIEVGDGTEVRLHDGVGVGVGVPSGTGVPPVGAERLAVEVTRHGLLWTDLVGGLAPRLGPVASEWTDDDLRAAMTARSRPLDPDELAVVTARRLRLLGGPTGPVARGAPAVARVLRLAAEAERLRSPRSGRAVAALHAALGPDAAGREPIAT